MTNSIGRIRRMCDVPIDIGFNRVTVRSRTAVERADDGCSWMLTLGIVGLAAAMNQVVIELFRRGQASNGGVGGYCSSIPAQAPHQALTRRTGVGDV